MPISESIKDFLAEDRIAFVGASRDPKAFANEIYRAFRRHGHALFPVHPQADRIEGDICYHSLAEIPDVVGGVFVMVNPEAGKQVVRDAVACGVKRVWLHRGVGQGSVSAEAVDTCQKNGIDVVDGACPLMFLEPVGVIHKVHRFFARRSVVQAN